VVLVLPELVSQERQDLPEVREGQEVLDLLEEPEALEVREVLG
jgi:hypothetical protein